MPRLELEGLADQMERELAFKTGDHCEHPLWHYTRYEAGLRGILTSRVIHATDFTGLEDKTEVRLGEGIIREAIESLVQSTEAESETLPAQWRSLLRMYAKGGRLSDQSPVLVASFSEDGDSLPMWGWHGGDGKGYVIGFKRLPYGHFLAKPGAVLGAALVQLRYDRDALVVQVRETLDVLGRHVHTYVKTYDRYVRELWQRGAAILLRRAAGLVVTMKHHSFAYEREWRLVGLTMPNSEHVLLYRDTPHGTRVPYVELPLCEEGDQLLPLVAVRLGPRAVPGQREMVVELLRSLGYPNPASLVLDSEVRHLSRPHPDRMNMRSHPR